jgi:hypothetical protein
MGDSDPKYSETSPAEHVRTLSSGKSGAHEVPIGSTQTIHRAKKGEALNTPNL